MDDIYFAINSSRRKVGSLSSTDFTVDLPIPITGSRAVNLMSLLLPNTFQVLTITVGVNDKVDFSDPVVKVITIPPGTYSRLTIASTLQTLFNAVSSTYTVTMSTANQLTITRTAIPAGAQTFTIIAAGVGQNNKIDFNVGGGPLVATIPGATYTRLMLQAAVQTALNAVSPGFIVTISLANKVTISNIPSATQQTFTIIGVGAGQNNKIDFNVGGGAQVATIPAGTYTRPAFQAAIAAALNFVASGFTVTITTANKVTIAQPVPTAALQTFTIVAGQNNKIDFNIGAGPLVATIPAGIYSRTAFASAVQAAMNAITPNFTVTITIGNKTTIAYESATAIQTFVFTAGNNNIDFDAGIGTQTATIPVGTYLRIPLETAIQTQLDAVSFGFVATIGTNNKLTITRNIMANSPAPPGNVSLPWSSGANAGNTCAALFGFSKFDLINNSTFTSDLTVANVGQSITAANNKFDFNDGLVKVVTLTNGGAVTPANMAADLQTKLNAISAAWVVTYNAGTLKFTITHIVTAATGSFFALWGPGGPATSARALFGFTNVDLTTSDFYTGTIAVPPGSQTVMAGANDAFAFITNGNTTRTVTIPAGTFTTTQLAANLQTAINTVSSTYVVLYDPLTQRFTVARATSNSLNNFSLLWASGPNSPSGTNTSAGTELGFSVLDLSGLATYTSDLTAIPQPFSLMFATGADIAQSAGPILGFSAVDLVGATTYTSDLTAIPNPQLLSLLFGTGADLAQSAGTILGFSPVDLTGALTYTSDLNAIPDATSFSLLFGTGANLAQSAGTILGFSPADLMGANTYTSDLTAIPNGNPFSLLFGTGANVATSAGPTLGFSAVDLTGLNSYTSDLTALFTPTRAFIQCDTLGINLRYTLANVTFAWEADVIVPLGSVMTGFTAAPPLNVRGKGPFNSLHFRLVDGSGNLINLGPTDWQFSINLTTP